MAGLLDVFGTGGTQTLGLLGMSPEEVQRARDDAQAQALFSLAGRLFQGGNTGRSIAEGLQLGQQAYKQALQGQMSERLQTEQIQEMLRQRQEAQAIKQRQDAVNRIIGQAYQPAVAGAPAQMVEEDGRYIGETPAVAARPAQFNIAGAAPMLMALPEGRAQLAAMADLMPKLRKAGITGQQDTNDNPFLVFTQDETIPKNIKTLAEQYSKSWAKGVLDPDVSDKRIAELSAMAQRAQERQTAQENMQAQQAQMAEFRRQGLAQSAEARALQAEIARGNMAIREADAMAKAEERNKPVTEAKEAINLINQAEELLKTSTGSLVGTGVDILAGSLGKSTPGAQSAAKLKAIQGALVAKMPKMSGPQSDKDVLLYREMAAQVGDSTLPTETRAAALQTLRQIQERYAKVPEGSSNPSKSAEQTSPFKFSPEKENRYQQWLKQQRP